MQVKTKEKLVPKLRFKEFQCDWKSKQIGEVSKVYGRIGYRGYTIKDIVPKGEGVITLSPSNFKNNRINIDKATYISWFKYDESPEIKIQNGDILLVKTGSTYGKCAFVINLEEKATINPQIVVLKEINICKGFLSYIVINRNIRKQIEKIVVGGAIPTISQKEISKMLFHLPSLPEQNKIAEFLSSVDKKIQLLEKKKEQLELYKKGVMQKIFSQEIRIKDNNGNGYPDWQTKELGEEIEHISKRNKSNEVKLVFSVSNKKGFITQKEQFDGYKVASKDLTNYKIVKRGEYAYNPSRINVGSIARLNDFDKGIVSPMYVVFKLKNNLNYIFFNVLLNSHRFKHLINVSCSGSVRESLNFDEMKKFKIVLPSNLEQERIAKFLSAIDKKIKTTKIQLKKTREFKKGLLQQMFV